MDIKVKQSVIAKERATLAAKWLGGIAVIFIAILILLKMVQPSVSLSEIKLSTADVGNIEVTVSATGKVAPAFEEIINSPISSRIVKVHQQAGALLEKGDPILGLDLYSVENNYQMMLDQEAMKVLALEKLRLENKTSISEFSLQLQVQKMELERMALELANQQYLDSLGASTASAVQRAEMEHNIAVMQYEEDAQKFTNQKALANANEKIMELDIKVFRRELEQLKSTLVQSEITAPARAVLSYVNNNVGSQISAGEKVAIISDLSQFSIDCTIADLFRSRVSTGNKSYVVIGKTTLEGRISHLNPVSANGQIQFSIQLQEPRHPVLQSGLFCEIHVVESMLSDVVRIAQGKYYKGPGTYQMFVREGNLLKKREVELGRCNYDYVEVISGIAPQEVVLVSTIDKIERKKKVKIKD